MLTTAQAAARMNTTRWTVRRWIEQGLLPATRVGRDWLIDEQDLAKFERPAMGRPAQARGKKGART